MEHAVFINYRGEDSHGYGALLYTELTRHFGDEHVFFDAESIPAGADFVEELLSRVRSARVLLAVIGSHWLTATDPATGRRRIDDPGDWIRRELAEAFAAGVRVIPILTDLADLPREAELPSDIAALSRCQYRHLRRREPTTGLARLVTDLAHLDPALAAAVHCRNGPPSPAPDLLPSQVFLADAAEQLARVVHDRWQREEEQRQVHDPYSLPVRWRPAPAHLTDRWDNIRGVVSHASDEPIDLTGELDQIARIYRLLPPGQVVAGRRQPGRLLVLGRAGSGKTILTLRFTLTYLNTRTRDEPVPVIVSIGSWDPTGIGFRDWLIDRLAHDYPDYPGLAARTPHGATLAAALVTAGFVLPVLDGFDEIAAGLRGAALEGLSETELPMLLTSRHDEYAQAVVAGRVPRRMAGVELADLSSADVVSYLRRAPHRDRHGETEGAAGTGWAPVLAVLGDPSNSPAGIRLAAVLATPLMITLARTVYRDRDPTELLDTNRFPTRNAIEDHLLASFVPTVYRHQPPRPSRGGGPHRQRNWDIDRVQRWLGFLAQHLDHLHTRDLAWWHMSDSLRRRTRILTVLVVTTVAIGVSDTLVVTPLYLVEYGFPRGLGSAVLEGIVDGPVGGLPFGLVYGLRIMRRRMAPEPSHVQVRLRVRHTRSAHAAARSALSRFAAGALRGVLLGGVVGFLFEPAGVLVRGLVVGLPPHSDVALLTTVLVFGMLLGLIFGVAVGLGLGIVSALETPLDIGTAVSPVHLIRTNRTTVARQWLIVALVIPPVYAFGGWLLIDRLKRPLAELLRGLPILPNAYIWPIQQALLVSAIIALGGGLSYVLAFTAWGQWMVLSRIWWPLRGRLPWAVTTFLDDAYHRGVLRQSGARYQFRHARLHDHLSHTIDTHRTSRCRRPL